MKQIIYATDCSQYSRKALKFVVEFCKRLDASLNILHIYSLPPVDNTTFRSNQHLRKNAEQEHHQVLSEYFESSCPGMDSKAQISFTVEEHNSITRAIVDRSNKLEADLVIVGRKDEHSSRGLFAGNIANALISRLACPLLIIPNEMVSSEMRSMVYASDFEADDVLALEQLCPIAKMLGAEMKVVHIPTKNEYSSEEQMEWFKELVHQKLDFDAIDFHLILSENVQDGLHSFIDGNEADLLVMLEREDKGYFDKAFFGDMVKKMKSRSEIPMLCYNRRCFNLS